MTSRMWILLMLTTKLAVLSANCQSTDKNGGITVTQNGSEIIHGESSVPPPKRSNVTSSDGIVVFVWDESVIERTKGLIRIYDASGKIWHVVDYFDDSLDAMSEPGGKFRPFNYQTGNFRLQMLCTGKSKHWFEVVVQGESFPVVKKYVKADDPLLKYRTWEEYLVGNNNLRFDPEDNPVLRSPNGDRVTLGPVSMEDWIPISSQGDWLRIRWGAGDNNKDVGHPRSRNIGQEGWIRWRRGDDILVGEFYR